MKNDFFLLDIPDFSPSYEEKIEYGYKNKAGKNLLELLRNISKNHCMYCYALLKSDRVDTGNLEHSIEKKLDEEHLEECVQNIALTCSHCNQSLKRTGEEERCKKILPQIELFREKVNCSGKMCKQECGPYKELKQEYGKVSRIILQPHGVHGINSQLKYCLQYDVKNAEFIPSTRYQYDENDIDYTEHHINQFRLNDIGFKTNALVEFLEDVINADGKYREKKKYSNYIVDLFMEKLKDFSQTDILKLCENLYTQYFLEFRSE